MFVGKNKLVALEYIFYQRTLQQEKVKSKEEEEVDGARQPSSGIGEDINYIKIQKADKANLLKSEDFRKMSALKGANWHYTGNVKMSRIKK